MMRIGADLGWLAGFSMALVRSAAFLAVAPPFAGGLFSLRVRGMLAIALAVACAPLVPEAQVLSMDTAEVVFAGIGQAVVGFALGFAVLGILSAARSAGEFIDNLTGSTLSAIFDPVSGVASPVFGRFYQLAFTAALFAVNGQLLLVAGFHRSFRVLPLLGEVDMGALARSAAEITAQMVVAALEIAGPLIVALFMIEVTLGLLSRAAPTLNVLVLGLGIKALVAVLLVAMFAPAIPELTRGLLDTTAQAWDSVLRGLGA